MTPPTDDAVSLRLALSEMLVNANAVARRIRIAGDPDNPRVLGATAFLNRAAAAWDAIAGDPQVATDGVGREEATLRAAAFLAHDLHVFIVANLRIAGLGGAGSPAARSAAESWSDFDATYRRVLLRFRIPASNPAPVPAGPGQTHHPARGAPQSRAAA